MGHQLRNIMILLALTLMGTAAGFVVGVLWATDQAVGSKDQNLVQSMIAAESELRKQADVILKLNDRLTQVTTERDYYKNAPLPTAGLVATVRPTVKPVKYFSGEELLQAVNKYRREHGVPELQLHSGLCQLSSRRLGEILDLGKLDNHAGFQKYFQENKVSDMAGPQLTNVAENLASGYPSPEETVQGWDSSPPHRTFLLADGSYKYGCASANLNFAVLIGGF